MNREKRKQRFKILSGIVSLIMAGAMMAGCKGDTPKSSVANTNLENYPIETDETLSWWIPLNGNVSAVSNSMEETEFAKHLQQVTGVDIEFIHPTQGQETEKFNLMIASDEMADMITYNFYNFSGGGASKAIKEQYILPLNDYMSAYSPNLKRYLDEHKDIDRMVKTDDGDYYVYPFLRGDESLCTYMGMLVRNDWLKELNLEVPETIDEWTNVLREFKNKKNCGAPLSFTWNASSINTLAGAFHASSDFLIDDNGNVKFGPIEDGYKDFVTLMNQWYTEGLLDSNISTVDPRILDTNVLSGKTGATFAAAGSGIGKWLPAMAAENPEFDLVAAPSPTVKKGEKPWLGQKDFMYLPAYSTAISTSCKNPELAAKFLDYGYSDEGHLLFNFGIENESYTMVDGIPTYTDIITNNPNGMSMSQTIAQYSMGSYSGPFVQDKEYAKQYYVIPQQTKAIEVWQNTDTYKHTLPFVDTKSENITENTRILSDVGAYVSEMTLKFITGIESIDNFDAYVEQCKTYGIDTVIKTKQEDLQRYNSR